jgi:hypothetical protein
LVSVVLLATLALGFARFTYGISPLGHSAFLRRRTTLPLPWWPSQLFYEHNGEHVVRVHMVLSPSQARALPAAKPISPESARETLFWFEGGDTPAAAQTLRPGAKLWRYCHCDPGWDTVSTFDSVHRDLWIVVHYTDWSGDEPACSC